MYFFVTADLGHKNTIFSKTIQHITFFLEYSSIGPKYTSYVKEKSVHALVFILWTFENRKNPKKRDGQQKNLPHLNTYLTF